MIKSQDCDVLIVGAGATGALAATVLAQGGLDVLCLEQGAWVEPGDHPHYSSDWTWQRRTKPGGRPLTETSQRPPAGRRRLTDKVPFG